MDFLSLAMIAGIVAIICLFGSLTFTKWTESKERIALSNSTEFEQRLDRLETEVAHLQGNTSQRATPPTSQVAEPMR